MLVSHVDVDVIDDEDVNVNVDIDDDHLFCHLVNLVRSQPDRICGYCPQEIGVTDLLMTMVKILRTEEANRGIQLGFLRNKLDLGLRVVLRQIRQYQEIWQGCNSSKLVAKPLSDVRGATW